MFLLTAGTPLAASSPYSRWWWVLGVLVAAVLIYALISMGNQNGRRLGTGASRPESGADSEDSTEREKRPPS